MKRLTKEQMRGVLGKTAQFAHAVADACAPDDPWGFVAVAVVHMYRLQGGEPGAARTDTRREKKA